MNNKFLSASGGLINLISKRIKKVRNFAIGHYLGQLEIRSIRNFRKHLRLVALVSLGLLIILGPFVYFLSKNARQTRAAWFDDSWAYRKAIAVSNSSGSSLTDFQVKILSSFDMSADVTAGKVQASFADLRFTDINGKLLNYWIEDSTSSSLDVWAKIPSIPTSGATVYMYYGNPSASAGKAKIGTSDFPALSCRAIYTNGNSIGDGIYWLDPSNGSSQKIQSYCDMTSQNGGWTMIFQRRSGNSNIDSCGANLNSFIHNTCGSLSSLNYIGSYSIDIDTLSTYTPASYLFYQFNSSLTKDTDDAFTINSSTNIFPDSTGVMNNISVTSICDINGANCDSSDAYFKYTGTGYFGSSNCGNGFSLASYNGNYGYCQNGIASYASNGLFGTRSAYDETKLWNYPNFDGPNWMERVFIKESGFTFSSASSASPGTEEQSKGPAAYWNFDEGTGTQANDSTSNKNHGTISGATWQTEDMCVSGKCLKFNGTATDSVDNTTVSYADNYTIEAWINPTNLTPMETYGRTIAASSPTASGYPIWLLVNGNRIRAYAYSAGVGSNYQESNFNNIQINNWYHVSVTATKNGTANIYINGQLDSSFAAGAQAANAKLTIGDLRPARNIAFQGKIDDVKLYPYVRSADEIKADYNSRGSAVGAALVAARGNDTLSNGLVGWWKMDETASPAIDSSGNGNSGTWAGTAAAGAGKFGNAISLDGDSDYVSKSDFNASQINTGTIAVWFKANSTQVTNARIVETGVTTERTGLFIDANKKLQLYLVKSGDVIVSITSTSTVNDSTWHHAVGYWNNNGAWLYIDGNLSSSTTGNKTLNLGSSVALYAGEYVGGGNYYFSGLIDETRIYNRALTPSEVEGLYSWAPGPVAHYTFDEGGGGTVQDRSGYANTGTWSGSGSHWTTGKFGKAGKFNGSSDYVEVADNASLDYNATQSKSISFWFNANDTSGVQTLISKWDNPAASGQEYILYLNGSTLTGQVLGGSSGLVTENITANNWYHVAITFNTSKLVTLYINGVQKSQVTDTGSETDLTSTLRIGQNASTNYFQGFIDDVRIYNYARTQGQIVEDMNAGHPIGGSPIASQVGYWKFDEGFGTYAYNSGFGGSALNGTFGTSTAAPAWNNDGKLGKALSFDGSNDYLTIGNFGSFYPQGSLSFWIKATEMANYRNPLTTKYNGGNSGIRFEENSSGNFVVVTGNDAGTYDVATYISTGMSINNWYHIIYTWDTSTNWESGFLNGKQVFANSHTLWPTTIPDLRIGTGFSTLAARQWKGLIDEVKIYNTALTADQVKLDYNQGQALVLGSSGVDADTKTASNSASRDYCVPGDNSTCRPPVGEWNFDEGGGPTANDTSGNGNLGTWYGTGNHWTPGKIGKAGKFNGSNDYVGGFTESHFDFTDNFTISAWINFKSLTQSGIITKYNSDSNRAYALYISSTLDFRTYNSNNPSGYVTYTPSTNTWYYVVVKKDSGTLYMFINGQQVSSDDTATMTVNDNDLKIGIWNRSSDYYFNGLIDQVKIYDYARSAAQIRWDYDKGGPVAWWDMDECQGATVYDRATATSSAGLNNGTVIIGSLGSQSSLGTCADSAASARYNGRNGKFNSSINFDGSDDYVDVLDYGKLTDPGSELTISAWIKPSTNLPDDLFRCPMGNLNVGTTTGWHWCIASSASGSNTYLYLPGGTAIQTNSKIYYNSGTWYHVVITYKEGTTTGSIYVNGLSQPATVTSRTFTASNQDLFIGRTSYGTTHWFPGLIDDVRIYNYTLTANQVKNIMNEGSAVRFGPNTGSP